MRGAGSANSPNISPRAAWFLACSCNLRQVPTGMRHRRSRDFRGRPLGGAVALNSGTAAAGTAGGARRRSASQRPCKTARTQTSLSRRCVSGHGPLADAQLSNAAGPGARGPALPPPSSCGEARDRPVWLPPVPIFRERAARMRPHWHVAIGRLSVLNSHWHSKRACVKIPVANATG